MTWTLLSEVIEGLITAVTPDEVAAVVVDRTARWLDASAAIVYVVEGEDARMAACRGLDASRYARMPLDAPLPLATAMRTRTPLWFCTEEELLAEYPHLANAAVPRSVLQSTAALPLVVDDVVLGGIAFSFGRREAVDDPARALLLAVARQCALALERARLAASERAARVAAEEANAMLRRDVQARELLIGVLGHDLRNPLSAILAIAAAFEEDLREPTHRRLVGYLQMSGERIRRMIDQLLDLTRLQQGGFRIERVPLDLAEVAQRQAGEVMLAYPGRRIQLEVAGNTEGHWDPGRMEQVLSNLLGNAVEHGAPEEPVGGRIEGGLDTVELTIANVGETIPPERLATVFDPFRKRDGTAATGLGLGLHITREIIRAHGGTLRVASEGGITSVHVVLPRTSDDDVVDLSGEHRLP
jgi:signal transduction histidine kinase